MLGRPPSRQQHPLADSSCNDSAGSVTRAGRHMSIGAPPLCSRQQLRFDALACRPAIRWGCQHQPWTNSGLAVDVATTFQVCNLNAGQMLCQPLTAHSILSGTCWIVLMARHPICCHQKACPTSGNLQKMLLGNNCSPPIVLMQTFCVFARETLLLSHKLLYTWHVPVSM